MTRDPPAEHDHSKTGTGGKKINPVYPDATKAPDGALYFNSAKDRIEHKNENGTVTPATGSDYQLEQESGSPYSLSDGTVLNPSSLDSFDVYVCEAIVTRTQSNATLVDLQINGNTNADYDRYDYEGNEITGDTKIPDWVDVRGTGKTRTVWVMSYQEDDRISAQKRVFSGLQSGRPFAGRLLDGNSGISEFTLQANANAVDMTVNVFGRNI